MNEELKNTIVKNAAYIETGDIHFGGIDIDFSSTRGKDEDKDHTRGEWTEHGVVHVGELKGSFEGYITGDAFKEMVKASVTITLEFIKAAPDLIRPAFELLCCAIKETLYIKRINAEARLAEAKNAEAKANKAQKPNTTKTTKAE